VENEEKLGNICGGGDRGHTSVVTNTVSPPCWSSQKLGILCVSSKYLVVSWHTPEIFLATEMSARRFYASLSHAFSCTNSILCSVFASHNITYNRNKLK
jgi:hypothetical protein